MPATPSNPESKVRIRFDVVPLHDSNMDRIPGRQSIVAAEQAARPLDVLELDLVDDVNDAEEGIEGRFDRVAPLDRGKSVKDFLREPPRRSPGARCPRSPAPAPASGVLVRMVRPDEVHRDVRVNEDHDPPDSPYPRSISSSSESMSAVGNENAAARRTAVSF